MKNKIKINAKCTSFIIRTFYNKKEYCSFYSFKIKNDEFTASDKSRFPFLKCFIKNNGTYPIYVNKNNPKEYISPYEVIIHKYYLIISILLLIIPLLLLK